MTFSLLSMLDYADDVDNYMTCIIMMIEFTTSIFHELLHFTNISHTALLGVNVPNVKTSMEKIHIYIHCTSVLRNAYFGTCKFIRICVSIKKSLKI